MDLKTIEDEIYEFTTAYFDEVADTVEGEIEFIENNNLYIPKENYTIVTDFLNTTLINFRVYDSKFMSSTLDKVHKDAKILQELYKNLKKRTEDIKNIFNTYFISSSPILTAFAKEIIAQKEKVEDSIEDRKLLKKLMLDFKELQNIYYEIFSEIFSEDKTYYTKGILEALNSKAFYFDKLLWKEALESDVIKRRLKSLISENTPNTKNYLLYTTGLMRPYTKEYQYLQSCIRIYK